MLVALQRLGRIFCSLIKDGTWLFLSWLCTGGPVPMACCIGVWGSNSKASVLRHILPPNTSEDYLASIPSHSHVLKGIVLKMLLLPFEFGCEYVVYIYSSIYSHSIMLGVKGYFLYMFNYHLS